ncbi:kinase-like domain-containing protein [Mycena albidolilacea]|uniref:Kinase-like domain-containing protein n=1 Tax=Mycena albidolilacea TaxID=1033008 RepID=A0AAD7APV8_9AGAR|nr:kinase-like domain-containing protein [Mycena albidolilacea]
MRDHRLLASRQLRALHVESDALRQEVNQWRERAGVPVVSQPRRDAAFVQVVNGSGSVAPSNFNDEQSRSSVRPDPQPMRQRSYSHAEWPFPSPPASGLQPRYSPSPVASNSPKNSSTSRGSSPCSGDSHHLTGIQVPAHRNASESSLDRFSEVESGESVDSSFSSSSRIEWELRSRHLRAHRLILAQLDLTGRVRKLDVYPVGSGGSADIYAGSLGHLAPVTPIPPRRVAIKIYRRMLSESQELEQKSKTLYKAAQSWSALYHPNVLPFLGVSLDLGLSPALITPLCPSGPIMKYLKMSVLDPSERLQMVGDLTAVPCVWLIPHRLSVSLKDWSTFTPKGSSTVIYAKKVLIDQYHSPVISGYGTFSILGTSSSSAAVFSTPIRFTPPEYFSDEIGTASVQTRSGDVYAFSMVMLEILSELEPYHHLPTEHAVFKHILHGGRPIRTHLDPHVVTRRIWNFLASLWHDNAALRPAMPDVLAILTDIDIREHESRKDDDYEPSSPQPSSPRDKEKKTSSGEETTFEETSLVGFHGRDLNGRIKQDDQYPFAAGGNSNIYRGKLTRSDGRKIRVAIKMIRISDDGSGQQDEMLRRLKREVDVWGRLKHKNILTFIGVCEDLAPLPVLISPFYKFGHVGKYISKHPGIDRERLVLGVASGLQFLHENGVVHGDLKVQNVLVDKHGTPCICDFGISRIVSRRGFTTSNVGTAPYMAPELFFVLDAPQKNSQASSSPSTTTSSDVYSFALLVLEILTAEPPKARPSRPIVTAKILADLRPKREDYDERAVPRGTWAILDRCWSFKPLHRPSIAEVLQDLTDIVVSSPPLAVESDELFDLE